MPFKPALGPSYDSGNFAKNQEIALEKSNANDIEVRREAAKARGKLLGFGIGNNNTYKTACKYSSGAIIGSAFIKHIKRNGVKSTKDFISEVTE